MLMFHVSAGDPNEALTRLEELLGAGAPPTHLALCHHYFSLSLSLSRFRPPLPRSPLAAGVDINQPDQFGNTLLHWAASRGAHTLVQALLAQGSPLLGLTRTHLLSQ